MRFENPQEDYLAVADNFGVNRSRYGTGIERLVSIFSGALTPTF